MEACANCGVTIGAFETPFVWCDEVVCSSCWTDLDTRQRRNRSGSSRAARDRVGIAAAAALISCIGTLYVVAGVEYELSGACTIGGVVLLAGFILIVAARPWSSS